MVEIVFFVLKSSSVDEPLLWPPVFMKTRADALHHWHLAFGNWHHGFGIGNWHHCTSRLPVVVVNGLMVMVGH